MKNVLMVAFHYPPIAGSAGALRTQAFVSYLPRHGWQPYVLAPRPGVYAAIDASAVVPGQGTLYRSWSLDTRRHLSWKGRYPESAAVPDRWVSWAPLAIATGLRIIRKHRIDAIWSTYPIATSHLIASCLARLTHLPWIAEFRDPVDPDGLPPLQQWAQRAIERRALHRAERTVFVTPGALNDYGQRYPERRDRLALIPNGYDESLEPAISPTDAVTRHDRPIRLVHTGHLYKNGRNPAQLIEAVGILRDRGRVDPSRLRIVFRNSQDEDEYRQQIDHLALGDIIALKPGVTHAEALQEQRAADGLLLLQGRAFNRQVPAKLFEYLRSRRPVLALVDEYGDTAALLTELGGARCSVPDNAELIAEALDAFLDNLRAAIPQASVNEAALAKYSRARQTGLFAELLDEVSNEPQ